MYSSNGRLVGTIPGESAFKYWFFDKKNVLIPDITNYTFTRGYYKFNFEVIDWKFASGLYSLVLETNRGVYETKLLLLK
jgi:roadblock/LC7 domain-containing protein